MNKKRGLLKTIRILLFIAILVFIVFLIERYCDFIIDEQEVEAEVEIEHGDYDNYYINDTYSSEVLVSELVYSINDFMSNNEKTVRDNNFGISINIPSKKINFKNNEMNAWYEYIYDVDNHYFNSTNEIESVLEKSYRAAFFVCIRNGDLYVKDYFNELEFYPKATAASMLDLYNATYDSKYEKYIELIEKYNYMVSKYNDREVEVAIVVSEETFGQDNDIYSDINLQEGKSLYIAKRDFEFTKLVVGLIILTFAIIVHALTSIRYVKINILQKINSEIFVVIGLITLIIAGFLIDQNKSMISRVGTVKIIEVKSVTAYIIILFLIFYVCFRECILKIKEKSFLNNSLIVIGIKKVINLYTNNSSYSKLTISEKSSHLKYVYVVFSVIYWIIFLIITLMLELDDESFMVIYFTIWTVVYVVSLVVKIGYENKYLKEVDLVFNQIDNMCKGDYEPMEETSNSQLNEIVSRLNSLSSGFEEAVDKRLSSEKMKVELITNVSHDLKTPLTSIISYVDLLKKEDISDVAKDYVQILEDKSNNLKNIVSDVFEMAKASSRDKVELEEIDGSMLIRQVLADMSDVIEKSGKIIREYITPDEYIIKGDGKRLYRALQNVIDNAIKYSMDGTRIYINSSAENNKFCINIKNISSYEMDFTEEEILERFSRGDKSRTTDGNGLGLAIAKSFVEASGGHFKIIIDGDVFNVIIVL